VCELHVFDEIILPAVRAESTDPLEVNAKGARADVALPPDLQHALLVVVPRSECGIPTAHAMYTHAPGTQFGLVELGRALSGVAASSRVFALPGILVNEALLRITADSR